MSDNRSHILIADDEPHIRAMVRSRLEQAGYRVSAAADGGEAFDLACEDPPALVVTDLQMPMLNGLELAMKLRCHAATAGIPLILLTARGYILRADESASTNIRKAMSKPFSAKELVREVHRLLDTRRSEAA